MRHVLAYPPECGDLPSVGEWVVRALFVDKHEIAVFIKVLLPLQYVKYAKSFFSNSVDNPFLVYWKPFNKTI